MSICSIDIKTKKRNIIFSKLSTVNKFFIYNGIMYFSGEDNDVNQVYSLNLTDNKTSLIYSSKDALSLLAVRNNKLYMLVTTDDGREILSMNIDGKKTKIIYPPIKYYSCSWDDTRENIYITFEEYKKTEKNYENHYCIINVNNDTISEVSEDKYNEMRALDKGTDSTKIVNGYYYFGNNSSITKLNGATGITETLVSGNDSEKYNYLTSDGETVVFWSGKVSSSLVAHADQYSGAIYRSLSHKTEGYTKADIYIMNADGNNIEVINSYTKQTGNSPTTSQNNSSSFESSSVPNSQTCRICNGRGRISCLYCNGSGKAISAAIGIGGYVSKGDCPDCGGSGEKTCTICYGTGILYN